MPSAFCAAGNGGSGALRMIDCGGTTIRQVCRRVAWSAACRAATVASLALLPQEALAHASDRGHVLLLPTGHYLVGGGAAVLLTFLVLAFARPGSLDRLARVRLGLGSLPTWPRLLGSTLCLALIIALIAAGYLGSRDPLSNPLPLMVWTMFWIGLTLLQGVVGNVWWWIDPWYAPWRAINALTKGRRLDLPLSWGYWPAVLQFTGFAWFELVYPAPDDPARLATVVGAYFAVNLLAMVIFGHAAWSRRGECLSVFLRMIAGLAVVEGGDPREGRRAISLCLPGAKLVAAVPLSLSGTLFLLLALSTVSFDGLMRTFFWLGIWGVNPLEFPGRTAMIASSSLGLGLTFLLLSAAFLAAVALGDAVARGGGAVRAAGALVWSIIPISMVYHFSHYLTALVVNGQYTLAALSDPLTTGTDLFGTAGMHVQAGVLMGAHSAWLVWNIQAAAIVGGHLLAVLVAHVIAYRLYGSAGRAATSQLPLAILMVCYTVFGLWLLSSPTVG